MANEIRLVDANALDATIESLAKKYERRGRLEAAKDYRFCQTVLGYAPTVDAVPVVHGYWRKYSDEKFMGYGADGRIQYRKVYTYECSKCGRNTAVKSNFCPNCGADMRERSEGE